MSSTHRGMSIGQHVDVGRRLYEIQEELTRLKVEVGNAQRSHHKELTRRLNTAHKAVTEARSAGDTEAIREYPTEWSAEWYYPGGSNNVGDGR